MAKAKLKYPRTLYKSPGTQKWVSKKVVYTYDSLIVNNEKEFDVAIGMGYIDSFHNAIFGEPVVEKKSAVLNEGF